MLEYWDGWLLNVAEHSLREKETAVAKKKSARDQIIRF